MTPVGKHVSSLVVGIATGVVGLILWLATPGVEVPIISLRTTGMVLVVLGGIETLVSGFALLNPRARHRNYKL